MHWSIFAACRARTRTHENPKKRIRKKIQILLYPHGATAGVVCGCEQILLRSQTLDEFSRRYSIYSHARELARGKNLHCNFPVHGVLCCVLCWLRMFSFENLWFLFTAKKSNKIAYINFFR